MKETLTDLKTRRSCKSFVEGKRVPDKIIEEIAEAGTYAPTGKGMQSPIIVIVNDNETVEQLSAINASILGAARDPFYGAPTVLVVLADKNISTYKEDGSLVMGNMLNAAHALGVGACWIHRARETFETIEGKELLIKWKIPENFVGIGNCILGYPSAEPQAQKPRKNGYIIKA